MEPWNSPRMNNLLDEALACSKEDITTFLETIGDNDLRDQVLFFTRLLRGTIDVAPDGREAFLAANCEDPVLRDQVAERLLERIFSIACDMPPAQRPAWLDEVCGADQALRAGVDGLLASELNTHSPFVDEMHIMNKEGQVVDSYKVERRLDGGGMGTVYLARQTRVEFDVQVAIKFLQHARSSEHIAMFMQEQRILAGLNHPNIVKISKTGQTPQGHPYFIMEYIEGLNIDRWCQGLSRREILDLFINVCDAVGYAQSKGVSHLDLKPGNIMIANGQVKLLDFGIARYHVESANASDLTPCTRSYASPEQIRGERLPGPASDVYALGILLHELLTGRIPRQEGAVPARVDTLNDHCLQAILEKCLKLHQEERYRDAAALADDLRNHRAGLPVTPLSEKRGYKLFKWAQRHSRALILAFAVILVMITAFFISAEIDRREEIQRVLGEAIRADRQKILKHLDEAQRFYEATVVAPRHNIFDDLDELYRFREKIRRIEARQPDTGDVAVYGYGYINLLLGDYQQSLDEMLKAWDLGYRDGRIAGDLARVHGRLFLQMSSELDEQRGQSSQTADFHLEKALFYARKAHEMESGDANYASVLYHLFEHRYDKALSLIQQIKRDHHYPFRAWQLEGMIYNRRGDERRKHGEYRKAQDDYSLAREALLQAADIARSYPEIYLDLANLAYSELIMTVIDLDGDVLPITERGLAACDNALITNPDYGEAWLMRSKLESRRYRADRQTPEFLEKAYGSIEKAESFLVNDHRVLNQKGSVLYQYARAEMDRGTDPNYYFHDALTTWDQAIDLTPNYISYNKKGIALKRMGIFLARKGRPAEARFLQAIDAFERALRQEVHRGALYNQASCYFELARLDRDVYQNLLKADALWSQHLEIDPHHKKTHFHKAYTLLNLAMQPEAAADRNNYLDQAETWFRKAGKISDCQIGGGVLNTWLARFWYDILPGEDALHYMNRQLDIMREHCMEQCLLNGHLREMLGEVSSRSPSVTNRRKKIKQVHKLIESLGCDKNPVPG